MKKSLLILSLLSMMLMVAPQALALEIKVSPSGNVFFYEDGVLGRNTDGQGENPARPIKTVPAQAQQRLQMKPENDIVKVRMYQAQEAKSGDFVKQEEMETRRLKMMAPAGPSPAQEQKMEQRSGYGEGLMEERQERREEMLEIRNQVREQQGQDLELVSRNIKARLTQGAQFEFDPETNQVMVTTPSGNQHVLEHLPDQALRQMKEVGLSLDAETTDDLEIVPTDENGVLYRTRGQRQERIFGLIPRQVPTEVILDDATGQVTERQLRSNSLFGQFLDIFSF